MKKVIIIGAGPAGLTAGCELLRQSDEYEVKILEQSGQMGGISKTVLHNGNRMDLGGHRFFSKNQRVMDFWTELLPLQGKPSMDDLILKRSAKLVKGGADPEKEDNVFLQRSRVSRIYYRQNFFDYPVKLNISTIRNLGFGTTIVAGCSYLKASIFKREVKSLEDFYINHFGKKLYRIFFEGYTEKLWGRHPSEISPDWGAQRVKGLSVSAVLKDIWDKMWKKDNRKVESSLIESFYYPKYGPGQLWETAAERFESMGGVICTECRVTDLHCDGNKIVGVTYQEKGVLKEEAADVVFSSMPVKDLVEGLPKVPHKMKRIAEGLPYRDFVTVGILVEKLKIKNQTDIKTLGDIVPDCWIYVQDKGVSLGRIQIFNNWSPYMVKMPQDTVWIGLEYFCKEGDALWNMTEEEWCALGQKELITIGVLDKETIIMDSHCEKVSKAYPAYFDTYKDFEQLEEWLNHFDNLYCIGRNGQHRYNNMDHSMLTAMEAVSILLSGSMDRSALWQVNTEQEYQEEKGETK